MLKADGELLCVFTRDAIVLPFLSRVELVSNCPACSSVNAKNNQLALVFKDLGAQISWRTVFLVEYFGPLWIHPLLYFFPQWFYSQAAEQFQNIGSVAPKHEIQQMCVASVPFLAIS